VPLAKVARGGKQNSRVEEITHQKTSDGRRRRGRSRITGGRRRRSPRSRPSPAALAQLSLSQPLRAGIHGRAHCGGDHAHTGPDRRAAADRSREDRGGLEKGKSAGRIGEASRRPLPSVLRTRTERGGKAQRNRPGFDTPCVASNEA
jgi:hypothetical protein